MEIVDSTDDTACASFDGIADDGRVSAKLLDAILDIDLDGVVQAIIGIGAGDAGGKNLTDESRKIPRQISHGVLMLDGGADCSAVAVSHDDDEWCLQYGNGIFQTGDDFLGRDIPGDAADEEFAQ